LGIKLSLIKLVSYIWDVPIARASTPQNEYLELVWSSGKKMLNTRNANFSFGNGYTVFEIASKPIEHHIAEASRILILGFGCGSILHLLEHSYGYKGRLVGVEYDSAIVALFKGHFADQYSIKPAVIIEEAFSYIKANEDTYDVIYVDLFIDLNNSPLIEVAEFWQCVVARLSNSGVVVINTIRKSEEDKRIVVKLLLDLSRHFKTVSTEVFQDLNCIITAKDAKTT
jgi:spermidine synthase